MCLSHSLWVLSKSTHQFDHNVPSHIPNGFFESLWENRTKLRFFFDYIEINPVGTLVGTFKKYLPFTHWVKGGQIVSEPTMYSACTHWVIDPLPPVSGKWEATHNRINRHSEEHRLLQACVVDLESLSGLQQTALQHCQDKIAGLEETVLKLAASVTVLERSVCRCRDRLLSPGLHSLGARGQLPSGSMLSTWRVLKQFTQLLPSG